MILVVWSPLHLLWCRGTSGCTAESGDPPQHIHQCHRMYRRLHWLQHSNQP